MTTPDARRKRSWRFRIALLAARLTRREVRMRFHASLSCGGHLPGSPGARLRVCPDKAWDLSGGRDHE